MDNDNVIEFDIDAARSLLNELEPKIDELCTINNQLVRSVKSLEVDAHDVRNTAVDEDYQDYAVILGEDGLKSVIININNSYEHLKETINEWEQSTKK